MTDIGYRASHAKIGYGTEYEAAYSSETYYGHLWRTIERDLVAKALKSLKEKGAQSCLDFACGTGRILDVASDVFEDTEGVDVSEAMIEVARSKCPDLKIYHNDITTNGMGRKFDVVTSFRFFRNAETELRIDALRAIRKHLSDDGWLVANIHGNPWSPGMIAGGMKSKITGSFLRTISRSEFARLLSDNGFEVVEMLNYSYLPRVGRFFPRWYSQLMGISESVGRKLPLIKHTSESTLFIARIQGSRESSL